MKCFSNKHFYSRAQNINFQDGHDQPFIRNSNIITHCQWLPLKMYSKFCPTKLHCVWPYTEILKWVSKCDSVLL